MKMTRDMLQKYFAMLEEIEPETIRFRGERGVFTDVFEYLPEHLQSVAEFLHVPKPKRGKYVRHKPKDELELAAQHAQDIRDQNPQRQRWHQNSPEQQAAKAFGLDAKKILSRRKIRARHKRVMPRR